MPYLDRISATTPAPCVLDRMMELMRLPLGNALSPYRLGSRSKSIIEDARQKVATLIGAQPKEITFTATGTEANNLAILGLAAGLSTGKNGSKIVISAIEHVSVMNVVRHLEKVGYQVELIPVDHLGRVNQDRFESALDDRTIFASIQLANPEIGTIQHLEPMVSAAHARGIPFHTDAIDAVGWIPVDVEKLGVDALSLSGSAFHGPLGAAALYVRQGTRLMPIMHGGIQERRRRPGVENIPAIAGLGIAAELAMQELPERMTSGTALADRLRQGLLAIEAVSATGDLTYRVPGHVSVIVHDVEGEALLLLLDMNGIQAASGSSCTAKDLKISPVLSALGYDHSSAQGSIVFSFVRDTTGPDIESVLDVMPKVIDRLREMSPLWSQRLKEKQSK